MKARKHSKKNLLFFKINPLIRILILSDMLVIGSAGMFAPLYALFVTNSITGANEVAIGLSMAIFLISRSVLQIPLAQIIDKKKGEKDDYYVMVLGSIIVGMLHFLFLGISEVWELYMLQMFLGIFSAITFPSYMAVFTRHIDKNMEGTEWGVYYTFVDLSTAGLAILGGVVASSYGYNTLVAIVSTICLLGGLVLIPVKSRLFETT